MKPIKLVFAGLIAVFIAGGIMADRDKQAEERRQVEGPAPTGYYNGSHGYYYNN